MQEWWIAFMVVGQFAVVAIIIWIIAYFRRSRIKVQADLHVRMLERFSSAKEFADFMETPAGRRFLESFTFSRRHVAQRILAAVQAGLVLGALGIAFLVLAGSFDDEGFLIAGVIISSLGAGFLLSGGVSYWFSKAWGLMSGESPAAGSELTP